jgi:tetratricopeptide (TPR) repeat protein
LAILLWIAAIAVVIVLSVISYGLILIPVAIGVALWIRYRITRPSYLATKVIKQARQMPGDQAVALLHDALEIDPAGPGTLRAGGDWFQQHECWEDAAYAYGAYLHQRADWDVEAAYIKCLVAAGRLDEAIPRLDHLRMLPMLEDESRASIISILALALLHKGDATQALAVVGTAPLWKHNLGGGLQQCLRMRAAAQYLLGRKSQAIADIDRLYAVNPLYPDVQGTKAEMMAGAFRIEAPKPYPDWYPHSAFVDDPSDTAEPPVNKEDRVKADVPTQTTGPSDENPNPADPSAPRTDPAEFDANARLSPDGLWAWDGHQWVPRGSEKP